MISSSRPTATRRTAPRSVAAFSTDRASDAMLSAWTSSTLHLVDPGGHRVPPGCGLNSEPTSGRLRQASSQERDLGERRRGLRLLPRLQNLRGGDPLELGEGVLLGRDQGNNGDVLVWPVPVGDEDVGELSALLARVLLGAQERQVRLEPSHDRRLGVRGRQHRDQVKDLLVERGVATDHSRGLEL